MFAMKNKNQVPNLSNKEAVILGILISAGEKEMFGLEIINESDGLLKRGTIYVTLQRMEEKNLVESRQEVREKPEMGIPRRLYRATGLGERAFSEYRIAHQKLATLIAVG
jgi:PadR family transcriptional regulator PadR